MLQVFWYVLNLGGQGSGPQEGGWLKKVQRGSRKISKWGLGGLKIFKSKNYGTDSNISSTCNIFVLTLIGQRLLKGATP